MQSEEEGAQLASGWHWGLAPRSCLRPRVLVRHRRASRASVFRGKLQGATEKQEHTPICVSLILGLSLLPELSSGGMGGRGTHASSREARPSVVMTLLAVLGRQLDSTDYRGYSAKPLDGSHPVQRGPHRGAEVLPKLPRHTPTAEGATEPHPHPRDGRGRLSTRKGFVGGRGNRTPGSGS